ncbi:hypothetical protein INQ08_24300, partial [Escherichia coli]|nr:hypothetical protein [Escherichia coli]
MNGIGSLLLSHGQRAGTAIAFVHIMFYFAAMQSGFGFHGHDDIQRWQRALEPMRALAGPLPRRAPIGALV